MIQEHMVPPLEGRSDTELFRERLLTLPENLFLDLARNYLEGEIQTPFHKHVILERLESWFRDPAVHARIRSFLSLRERRMLGLVRLLAPVDEETLWRFLSEDMSRLEFHLKLLNLEDRLLIFREPLPGDAPRYRMVPFFEPVLRDLLGRDLLVPSESRDSEAAPSFSLDHLTAAVLSAMDDLHVPVNRKGEFRKREGGELEQIFGPLLLERAWPWERQERFLHLLIRGCHHLGLLSVQGNRMWIDHDRLQEFSTLPADLRRHLFCASALYPEPEMLRRHPEDENPEYFSLSRIWRFMQVQESFLALLAPREAYGMAALDILKGLVSASGEAPADTAAWAEGLLLLDRLHFRDGFWQVVGTADAAGDSGSGRIFTEGNFVVTVTGNPGLDTLLPLTGCARMESFGPSSRWTIQKDRFLRWITHGGTLDILAASLGGKNALPGNVAFTIASWQQEQEGVTYADGVLVMARGPRQAILDHLAALEPWVVVRPGPGMVILDRGGHEDWVPILRDAGIPVVLWEEGRRKQNRVLPGFSSIDPREPGPAVLHSSAQDFLAPADALPEAGPPPDLPAVPVRPALINELLSLAEQTDAPDEVREELRQRIRDGVILFPRQVSASSVRLERLEARGLDFQGKKRVMEQVIRSGRDFLELVMAGDEAYHPPMTVLPVALRQSGAEFLLVARTVPEGREMSLLVRKVQRIRRVRSGIFF